jgi:hypothetical protein
MIATSCSTSWISTFDSYVGIAAPAVVEIVTAIDTAESIPINQTELQKINQDAQALKTLGQSVVTATGLNLPTTCAAFNQAVVTFAGDVPSLEQISQITDPVKIAEITSGIALVQGVITAIEQPIAACQTAPNNEVAKRILVKGAAKIQSPSDFVTQYNKLNLGKKLHVHSWPVRYATLGLEK